ncbi:MAG: tetratricopeptide repeat protein [Flavobacteriales bacterium]
MIKNIIFFLSGFVFIFSCNYEQELDYEATIEKGQLYIENNKIDSAIILFNEALKIDQNRVEAHYGLGFAYSKNCFNKRVDCEKAIELFAKVNEIEPNYRRVYYNQALCKGMLFDYKSAIIDMDKQIALDGTDSDYFKNRGGFKLLLNDTIGACEDYKRSVELGGDIEQKWINEICE